MKIRTVLQSSKRGTKTLVKEYDSQLIPEKKKPNKLTKTMRSKIK